MFLYSIDCVKISVARKTTYVETFVARSKPKNKDFLSSYKYTRSKNFCNNYFRVLPFYGKGMPGQIKDIHVHVFRSIRMSTNISYGVLGWSLWWLLRKNEECMVIPLFFTLHDLVKSLSQFLSYIQDSRLRSPRRLLKAYCFLRFLCDPKMVTHL